MKHARWTLVAGLGLLGTAASPAQIRNTVLNDLLNDRSVSFSEALTAYLVGEALGIDSGLLFSPSSRQTNIYVVNNPGYRYEPVYYDTSYSYDDGYYDDYDPYYDDADYYYGDADYYYPEPIYYAPQPVYIARPVVYHPQPIYYVTHKPKKPHKPVHVTHYRPRPAQAVYVGYNCSYWEPGAWRGSYRGYSDLGPRGINGSRYRNNDHRGFDGRSGEERGERILRENYERRQWENQRNDNRSILARNNDRQRRESILRDSRSRKPSVLQANTRPQPQPRLNRNKNLTVLQQREMIERQARNNDRGKKIIQTKRPPVHQPAKKKSVNQKSGKSILQPNRKPVHAPAKKKASPNKGKSILQPKHSNKRSGSQGSILKRSGPQKPGTARIQPGKRDNNQSILRRNQSERQAKPPAKRGHEERKGGSLLAGKRSRNN